jgi:hypothetical protein
MAFWYPQSKTFSTFLHRCKVLKSGYGRLKPLQEEASDMFAQEDLKAMNPKLLLDPFVSNHTNIGRAHEILAD